MTTPIDISPEAVEKLAVGMQYNGREDVHDMLRALRTELTASESLLRDLKGVFAGEAAPHWVNQWDTTMMRGHWLDRIDAILMKGEI